MTSPESFRPRLGPARADIRRAVREHLESLPQDALVLVALSGGADSLALASALAFESTRAGRRAGAVIIDHGLQSHSAAVASRAAEQARAMGLDPVEVVRVEVSQTSAGLEADARAARYAALRAARTELGASVIMLGHTLDDQAETVLLGLARGSGTASLAGMRPERDGLIRPLLGITRVDTESACREEGLEWWDDPHNQNPEFTRVRVRQTVLPMLEHELGPGIASALARSASQLAEDADLLDELAGDLLRQLDAATQIHDGVVEIPVSLLAEAPAALRQRAVRSVIRTHFGTAPTRVHTLAVVRLVTDWHGQDRVEVEGGYVRRQGQVLRFHPAIS